MSNQLTFNNTALVVTNHNNQIYLTSSELARALGYSDQSSITRIYNRNIDEFSKGMTETVKLTASKGVTNLLTSTRIFSLRGCHLIAMFSRTKIAKDFRKWVLDILDKEVQPQILNTITKEQQQQIKQAVNQKVFDSGLTHQSVYSQLYKYFKIPKYQDLPASKFNEAMLYLGGNITDNAIPVKIQRPGRWLVVVGHDGSTKIVDASHKNLVDTEVYNQLRSEIHEMADFTLELARRMRIVNGEYSVKDFETPLLQKKCRSLI